MASPPVAAVRAAAAHRVAVVARGETLGIAAVDEHLVAAADEVLAHPDLAGFLLAIADDEHEGDLPQLRVTDLAAHRLGAVVDLRPDAAPGQLGHEPRAGLLLDERGAEARVRELSRQYGLSVDPTALIEEISVGQEQRVEILKALYREARILILDEPTAVLTPQEAESLFETLRTMAAEGRTVIFISHKLHEVKAVSDNVTVLRAGRTVATVATADRSPAPPPLPPRPRSSAVAIHAAGTALRDTRPAPPHLTALSHRHIHQLSCELAVLKLTIRRRPPPPR